MTMVAKDMEEEAADTEEAVEDMVVDVEEDVVVVVVEAIAPDNIMMEEDTIRIQNLLDYLILWTQRIGIER